MGENSDIAAIVSHCVLGGAALYCMVGQSAEPNFETGSYGIIACHNIIGVLHHAFNLDIENIYSFTRALQYIFALPCVAARYWTHSDAHPELAFLHPLSACIPLVLFITDKGYLQSLDVVHCGNCISAIYVTIMHQNWVGVGSVAAFIAAYGIERKGEDLGGLSKHDSFNYVFAAFTILSFFAMSHF